MKNKSEIFSSSVVEHAFLGRQSGSSSGVYASLNCSKFVGDDDSNVAKNLDHVREMLSASSLITLNQCHSISCIVVDATTKPDLEADAMVTNVPGIAIGVLTADCAPILLADEKHKIIGAAHAGWRGAVHGVIKSTIDKMVELGADINEIKAAVGPCIGKDSYEIGEDFMREFKGSGSCFAIVNSHLHFDLPKYCREQLLNTGVISNNIDVFWIDTFANPDDYFSYRYANMHTDGKCGRNISAICLK